MKSFLLVLPTALAVPAMPMMNPDLDSGVGPEKKMCQCYPPGNGHKEQLKKRCEKTTSIRDCTDCCKHHFIRLHTGNEVLTTGG